MFVKGGFSYFDTGYSRAIHNIWPTRSAAVYLASFVFVKRCFLHNFFPPTTSLSFFVWPSNCFLYHDVVCKARARQSLWLKQFFRLPFYYPTQPFFMHMNPSTRHCGEIRGPVFWPWRLQTAPWILLVNVSRRTWA